MSRRKDSGISENPAFRAASSSAPTARSTTLTPRCSSPSAEEMTTSTASSTMGGRTPCPLGRFWFPDDAPACARTTGPGTSAARSPSSCRRKTDRPRRCDSPRLSRSHFALTRHWGGFARALPGSVSPSRAAMKSSERQVAAAPRCSSPLNASRKTDTPENQPLPAGAIGYSLLEEHTTSLSDGGRKAWSPCWVRGEASEARVP